MKNLKLLGIDYLKRAAKIKYMYFKQGKRQCEIFKELGISKTMVQTTVSGKCWKHVPIPD